VLRPNQGNVAIVATVGGFDGRNFRGKRRNAVARYHAHDVPSLAISETTPALRHHGIAGDDHLALAWGVDVTAAGKLQ
jgi:hypothetical protein